MARIILTQLEQISEQKNANLRTHQQEWKQYNHLEEVDEKSRGITIFSFSRRCELCGSVGYVAKRIHRLRRKMKYNQEENRYECQNRATCEERVEKFIDGRWTLTDELWR